MISGMVWTHMIGYTISTAFLWQLYSVSLVGVALYRDEVHHKNQPN